MALSEFGVLCIDAFDRFAIWAWGPYEYPRWQRRVYIIFWPILMPLRWGTMGILMITAMVVWGIYSLVIEVVGGLTDAGCDLVHYVREKWRE